MFVNKTKLINATTTKIDHVSSYLHEKYVTGL
jgi:hypothetical protein